MSTKRKNSEAVPLALKKSKVEVNKPVGVAVKKSRSVSKIPKKPSIIVSSREKLPENILERYQQPAGQVLAAGCLKWRIKEDALGNKRKLPDEFFSFRRFTKQKFRYISSGCSAGHSILIRDDGKVYGFGRNSNRQLGVTGSHIDFPTLIPGLDAAAVNVISAACGANHTLFLTDTGDVYALGDNSFGQCGVKSHNSVSSPQLINYDGPAIVKVDCGSRFSAILDIDGNLHTFGHPEFGVLGHSTDGRQLVEGQKYVFTYVKEPKKVAVYFEENISTKKFEIVPDVKITDFSCGTNHIVAVDDGKHAFSWGCGGYGRLGHSTQEDQFFPRLIKFYAPNGNRYLFKSALCANMFTLVSTEDGSLYLMGKKYTSKNVAMYPQYIMELNGWKIDLMANSDTGTLLVSEGTLIAWGSSPNPGILGLGAKQKSSSAPTINEACTGMKFIQVAMGYAHSMLLVDMNDAKTKQMYKKFDEFSYIES